MNVDRQRRIREALKRDAWRVSMYNARENLPAVVAVAGLEGQPVTITKHGRAVAVIQPVGAGDRG